MQTGHPTFFAPATDESLKEDFLAGQTFAEFLPTARENVDLWNRVYERATVPQELVDEVAEIPNTFRLLVISADWCGDAANLVPVMVRFAERADIELRVIDREERPHLIEARLTNGRSKSIPVVVLLDEDYREIGWWGPRPAPLQDWVMDEGLTLEPEERYKRIRQWYARDHGMTTLAELVSAMTEATAQPVDA